MSFSGTTIINFVNNEAPHDFFTSNFDVMIFVYVHMMNWKIVCLQDISLSQQG